MATPAGPPSPPSQREYQLIAEVWGKSVERRELPDGYALRFPDSAAWRQKLDHFLKIAPGRYAAMHFELAAAPGELWLNVTGGPGTRDYVAGAYYMLNSTLNPRQTRWHQLNRLWRRGTQNLRRLPDFIIFGAMKSGTTSLYAYLIEHPGVVSAAQKETYFFNVRYQRGTGYYRSFFPLNRPGPGRPLTGEATPFYIYHPEVPERIYALLPGVRLIAILRNPVDRAYSHYQHRVRMGLEPLAFAAALDQEAVRLEPDQDEPLSLAGMNTRLVAHGYQAMGRYAEQLRPWFDRFDKDQIFILTTEALAERPEATFDQVTRFLGLGAWQPADFRKLNRGPYGPMADDDRRRLIDYFRPHNQALQEMAGIDLNWDR